MLIVRRAVSAGSAVSYDKSRISAESMCDALVLRHGIMSFFVGQPQLGGTRSGVRARLED
ncbi:hypothetical protein [Saccharopolyspora halophila]|uniref:hypothetical protein n=1 Tax=Saccharopolyspora halophila TaxID=405551 RepID=UPI0031CF5235